MMLFNLGKRTELLQFNLEKWAEFPMQYPLQCLQHWKYQAKILMRLRERDDAAEGCGRARNLAGGRYDKSERQQSKYLVIAAQLYPCHMKLLTFTCFFLISH